MIDPIELMPADKSAQVKVIRLPAGGRVQVVMKLVDKHGKPVTLTQEPVNLPAPAPQFGYQRQVAPGNVIVRLRAKESFGNGPALFDVVGDLLDPCGHVVFNLDESLTCHAGVYLCEVGRFATPDYLVDTWPCYLALEPSVFSLLSGTGPITIPEIRLGLDDLEMSEVSLLDGQEFSDVQILYAIRQVVDMWNETLPPVALYSTENFPFRYHWIKGTIAHLYRMRAHKYRRNQLAYSAGGVTIDDQNKSAEYQAIADQLMQELKEWMRNEKVRQNMSMAWATGL
jgi:hypothetical protein